MWAKLSRPSTLPTLSIKTRARSDEAVAGVFKSETAASLDSCQQSIDGPAPVCILLAGHHSSAAPFQNRDPSVPWSCLCAAKKASGGLTLSIPFLRPLTNSWPTLWLEFSMPAGYSGKKGYSWSHVKHRLRKLFFFLSSINLTWENIWTRMARFTNKINYYSYESSWWFGISFWAHV